MTFAHFNTIIQAMSDTAHIFMPQDDTLQERVRAYRSVSEAFRNVEASMKHMNDKEWADRLGEKHEVEEAYAITRRSLHMATKAITADELREAREQGLMSLEEVRGFTKQQRAQEMHGIREEGQASDSSEHGQNQKQ
jgi:hypothetical protein